MSENCSGELEKPFIPQGKRVDENETNGSIRMALLSTCVAVCGSFEFGSCLGFSSPTQSAIREDLNLSVSQYSTFGSIITIGAMIGAITSGRVADFIGRKGVPVFIAEIAPTNIRGGLATLTGLIPCFLLLVSLFFIPESPRWLAKVGLRKERENVPQKLSLHINLSFFNLCWTMGIKFGLKFFRFYIEFFLRGRGETPSTRIGPSTRIISPTSLRNLLLYVSQFSEDGSLFVAGFQESHIRIYDVDMGWKLHKDMRARSLRWTITDTSLSPNRRFLVYSSISPVVHIVDVGSGTKESHANVTEIHEGLEFSSNVDGYDDYSFGIFSVKFSKDGRELVAASSDESIYVYDLESKRLNLKIPAHMSDVNAVCFADESGHVIYSGSDDHLCKVWDRRCFVSRGQAAGVLMGHLEGITFIDTRGDGRYFISNGKDRAIKLWDIRKMSSNVNYQPRRRYAEWDYRWVEYPEHARNMRHLDDLSLATYKGHTVLRTLIRCYFSPAYSTGQKYIYTGSTDSAVYVYDVVSGDQVAKLDFHEDPIRDCNWHPFFPTIVSSSWDGTIARWEFPGNGDENALPAKRSSRRRRFFY